MMVPVVASKCGSELKRQGTARRAGLGARLVAGLATAALLASSAAAAERKKPPPEESISLRTKDGVNLHCMFYPGMHGKKSVPMILLHGWEGQGADYTSLARGLQQYYQCAVIVPDLRGHGRSTTRTVISGQPPARIRTERMRARDIQAMYLFDVEAVKKFLLEKHNAGELNIELLGVVGAEMGAVIAVSWVAQDWSWPRLPTYKQGQDVKAFVLISPPSTFKGVKIMPALARAPLPVRQRVSAMIVYGKRNTKDTQPALQIYKALKRYHDPQRKDLELLAVDSNLQGTRLLNARGLNVGVQVAKFIRRRLADIRDQYPWQPRINPLSD